jgi:HD-GYP domain-containing protein (c-di-GMP phosphodiesterase class II)
MSGPSKAAPEPIKEQGSLVPEEVVPEEILAEGAIDPVNEHEPILAEAPVAEPACLSDDIFESDSIKNMRGLDNIITAVEALDEADDVVSKFYRWCASAADLLHAFESPDDCELTWQDICRCTERLDVAIEEEFGEFWIEALDSDVVARDYFAQRHNINACIICLKLAQALKYKKSDQLAIAGAALVHDVGDASMTQKKLSFSRDRNRIERSVNIVKKASAPADMLCAISECDERLDGSGSPKGLRGPQISLKGQLLGVAVAFERLFSDQQNNFKKQGTAFEPVMQMLKEHRDHFQPQVLKSLLLTSGFYQVGAIVELNSGSLARVITQNPGSPLRPLVEVVLDRTGNHPVRRQLLDLRENLTLSIVRTVAKGK